MKRRILPPDFRLQLGRHPRFADGANLFEAVAYVAGQPHSNRPADVSIAIVSFIDRLEGRLHQDEYQRFIPLISLLVDSAVSEDVEHFRAIALVDAAARHLAPMAFDARSWTKAALTLRSLERLDDRAAVKRARSACWKLSEEARARAYDSGLIAVLVIEASTELFLAVDSAASANFNVERIAADAAAAIGALAVLGDGYTRRAIIDETIATIARELEVAP